MKKILQFEIEKEGINDILIQEHALFLSVAIIDEIPHFFALVDTSSKIVERTVHLVKSGHIFNDNDFVINYIGTISLPSYSKEPLHFFEQI